MKKKILALAIALITVFSLAACGSSSDQGSGSASGSDQAAASGETADKGTIIVGSKGFTENLILSELYALALEDAGYKAERVYEVQNAVINDALVEGEIDIYPEYTGTSLMTILGQPMESDPQKVYDIVKDEYAKQFNIAVLDMTEASDGEGLVMLASTADKYGIKTVSDLWKHASELRFGSTSDFYEREDGFDGLKKAYGDVKFKEENSFDNALKYEVLKNDESDVVPAYTTDAQLSDDTFLLLEDDKAFWPPYNIIPVTRQDVLDANPDIADIINNISSKIDSKTMQELNAKVDIDLEEYDDVAKEFYESIK